MFKKIKKAAAAACAAAVMLVMSGCMRIGINVEVRENGTAALSAMYAMDSAYCTEEDFADSEYEVKTFNIDGTEYIGYEMVEEYSSYETLESEMTSLAEDGTVLFKSANIDKKSGLLKTTYTFDATMTNLMGEDVDSETAAMTNSMLKVDFGLKMPGKVKSCDGGTINDDGSITFHVTPDQECTFSAVSETTNFIPLIAIAAVVVIAVVIVLTKVKR